jgi:hypothetical protein
MEFIDDGSRFWLIEVNPLPDISHKESFLGVAASYWGIDFDAMISLVLLHAVEEYAAEPEHAARFAPERVAPLRDFVAPGLRALAEFGAAPVVAANNGKNAKNGKSAKPAAARNGQRERNGARTGGGERVPANQIAAPANAGVRGR